jgi:ubiquinone/menaquinone biosynthesis C-methylase UbiE
MPRIRNADDAVVRGFGDEWARLDQGGFTGPDFKRAFDAYFHIFPWHLLSQNAEGFDLGCGSGRWARAVAPRVGILHCIEPSSEALRVARKNLAGFTGVRFSQSSVEDMNVADGSMDFGYCLGVLHHVPDTRAGIESAVAKLKPGAPFLIYLYYAFDNQPKWFRAIHGVTAAFRVILSRTPFKLRYAASQVIAAAVYWPMARAARIVERLGVSVHSFPLAYYRNRQFYVMRTDALDRFGTRLEKRFTKDEIREMMETAGLRDITFSQTAPFWTAVGIKAGRS